MAGIVVAEHGVSGTSSSMHDSGTYETGNRSGRLAAAGVIVILHAGVIALLLQLQPVRSALTRAVPVMGSLIPPPRTVEQPRELHRPLPVRPRAQRAAPRPEPQLTAAPQTPPPSAAQPEAPPPAPAQVAAPPGPPPPMIPPSYSAAYLDNPPPAYPAAAKRMRLQGKVMLHVLVNTGGTADRVELRSSCGYGQLDDAALETVKRWRFVPARQGDRPVAAWVLIPIDFSLES